MQTFRGIFNFMEENEEKLLRVYGCATRATSANKRFIDNINKKDVLSALKLNNYKCFYCNSTIDKSNWQLDHFYPRALGGKNERKNLVACCRWCNTMKNALDGNAFISKCNHIVNNNFFELNGTIQDFSDKISNMKYRAIKRLLKRINVSDDVIEGIDSDLKVIFFNNMKINSSEQ